MTYLKLKTGDQVVCAVQKTEQNKKHSIYRFLWATLDTKERGEWISLVGFHRLIDQKQEDCNNNEE